MFSFFVPSRMYPVMSTALMGSGLLTMCPSLCGRFRWSFLLVRGIAVSTETAPRSERQDALGGRWAQVVTQHGDEFGYGSATLLDELLPRGRSAGRVSSAPFSGDAGGVEAHDCQVDAFERGL